MLQIREYHPADLADLVRMYEREGFTYPFPELDDPLFFEKLVLEREGRVRQAIICRGTCEGYLFMDREAGDPQQRWDDFRQLLRAAERDLLDKGLEDEHVWVPPSHKSFGRRLVQLGFVRDDEYTPYCKHLVK